MYNKHFDRYQEIYRINDSFETVKEKKKNKENSRDFIDRK